MKVTATGAFLKLLFLKFGPLNLRCGPLSGAQTSCLLLPSSGDQENDAPQLQAETLVFLFQLYPVSLGLFLSYS